MNLALDINYFAVLAAAVIDIVLYVFWYSKLMFRKNWMKIMKLTDEDMGEMQKNAAPGYITSTFASIITAFVMVNIVQFMNVGTFVGGIQAGFFLWLGFVVSSLIPVYFFENRPKGLYLMYIGYKLVSFMAMGIILAMWQ